MEHGVLRGDVAPGLGAALGVDGAAHIAEVAQQVEGIEHHGEACLGEGAREACFQYLTQTLSKLKLTSLQTNADGARAYPHSYKNSSRAHFHEHGLSFHAVGLSLHESRFLFLYCDFLAVVDINAFWQLTIEH